MSFLSVIKNKFLFKFFFKKLGDNVKFLKNIKLGGIQNISIGDNVVISENSWLEAILSYNNKLFNPEININNNVSIGRGSVITAVLGIDIGDDTLIGPHVFITDHFHGDNNIINKSIAPINRDLYSKGKVTIGKGVWIGFGAVILPGVIIGDYAIVGANSVITKNVEAYTIVAGNPAKLIKRRD